MKNKGLLNKIRESHSKKVLEEEVLIRINKYMIISINEKKYAIHARDVREIISGIPLFYIPFTPPYIRGFINRHGEPYTVLDLTVIFEREKLDSSTFLVLSREDDQLALLISEVLEIVKLPETELHKITSTQDGEDYFLGSISPEEKEEIFVLNLEQVLTKLEADLGGL